MQQYGMLCCQTNKQTGVSVSIYSPVMTSVYNIRCNGREERERNREREREREREAGGKALSGFLRVLYV